MSEKIDVLFIHGGMTFKNEKDYLKFLKTRPVSIEKKEGWSGDYLDKKLGKDFNVIRPRMPLQDNAQYKDWKIFFERYLPLLSDTYILIGNSLGGVFLAKYLSENKLSKKSFATFLVCPPFDDDLTGEDLVGGFTLKSNLSRILENSKHLHLLFSKDDDVVPVSHAEKYRSKLRDVHIEIFENKNGHFRVAEFPEIIKMIKLDVSKKINKSNK